MDTSIATLLSGSMGAVGVLAAFCVLFITGRIYPHSVVADKDAEIAHLQAENTALRDRADVALTTAQGTRDVLAAIQTGVAIARGETRRGSPEERP